MLVSIYLFCLVLGGILVGASALLGGHDADVGGDADVGELGAGLELGDGDAGDAGFDKDIGGFDGASLLWIFKSFRFWSFFSAFFGLTGLTLHVLELAPALVVLGISLALGFAIGGGASYVLRWLTTAEVGVTASEQSLIGKTGRILVEVKKGQPGKIRVMVQAEQRDFVALTDGNGFAIGDEAEIIELRGDKVLVDTLN